MRGNTTLAIIPRVMFPLPHAPMPLSAFLQEFLEGNTLTAQLTMNVSTAMMDASTAPTLERGASSGVAQGAVAVGIHGPAPVQPTTVEGFLGAVATAGNEGSGGGGVDEQGALTGGEH